MAQTSRSIFSSSLGIGQTYSLNIYIMGECLCTYADFDLTFSKVNLLK